MKGVKITRIKQNMRNTIPYDCITSVKGCKAIAEYKGMLIKYNDDNFRKVVKKVIKKNKGNCKILTNSNE